MENVSRWRFKFLRFPIFGREAGTGQTDSWLAKGRPVGHVTWLSDGLCASAV